jgi:flavin-dependent dehydrogenase
LPAGTLLMACAPRGYVGVTHVEAGQIELAAAFAPEFLRDCSSLGAAANQVLQAAGMSPVVDAEAFTWRGTPALTSVAPEVTAERLFAIGDATGYVEPFTGEGIAWAMTAAVQVVPLVERATESWSTDLADQWRQQAAQISRRQQRFCRLMSRLLRHPLGVQATLGLLSVVPQLATPFVRWRDAPATLPPLFSSKVTP